MLRLLRLRRLRPLASRLFPHCHRLPRLLSEDGRLLRRLPHLRKPLCIRLGFVELKGHYEGRHITLLLRHRGLLLRRLHPRLSRLHRFRLLTSRPLCLRLGVPRGRLGRRHSAPRLVTYLERLGCFLPQGGGGCLCRFELLLGELESGRGLHGHLLGLRRSHVGRFAGLVSSCRLRSSHGRLLYLELGERLCLGRSPLGRRGRLHLLYGRRQAVMNSASLCW